MDTQIENQTQPDHTRLHILLGILALVMIGMLVFAYIRWQSVEPLPSSPSTAQQAPLTPEEIDAKLAELAGTSTPPTSKEIAAKLHKLSAGGGTIATTSAAEIQAKLDALK